MDKKIEVFFSEEPQNYFTNVGVIICSVALRKMKINIDYNQVAKFYDGMFFVVERFVSNQRKDILRQVEGVILEVGVGTGSSFKDYPPGKQIIAIDASKGMLRLAEKKIKAYNDQIELHIADAQYLPFRDETFDTIFTSLVLCSVHNPVRGLREMRRVLKKDGCLLMIEHVKSENKIVGYIMEKINPLVARFDNINRETVNNLKLAGFTVKQEQNLAYDIVKSIVASK